MGLKMKIGLGFFVVLLFFLAMIIFGNIIGIQNIPPANSYLVLEDKKANSASLQQIAEPTRYFNDIETGTNPNSVARNLTKELASKLSKGLVEINPNGPTAGRNGQSLIAPPLIESIDAGVIEAFKKFDQDYFLPPITKESLKIVSNSQEAFDYYVAVLPMVLRHRASDLNFSLEAGDLEERLPKAVSAFEEIINKLYQLPTPERLAELHRRTIGLILGKKRVLETLLNQEEDPVQAILAIQMLEIIDEEFKKLKSQ